MNKTMKRVASFVLTLVILVSLFAGLTLSADGATYAYNSGKRGTVCTALSSMAKSYYTGSNTYETLSQQSASNLKNNLKSLMTSTQKKVTSYNELRTLSAYTDSTAGSTSKMTMLYSSDSLTSKWDNGTTWNREHVWCQSLGSFTTTNAGSDIHHLHPCDSLVNSTRGNHPYGSARANASSAGKSYTTVKSKAGTVAGYYYNDYYEPLDNAKGDIARTLLYVYVRWGEQNLYQTANGRSRVIESLDTLLNWVKLDPVDTWEMGRNDVAQSIQGNRNVFVDYPEYAYLIFGKSVPSMTTPSGKAKASSGGTTPTTPVPATSDAFTLVTKASQLSAGAQIVIAAHDYNVAISTSQSTNNRPTAPITKKSDGTITFGSNVAVFTLGTGTASGSYSIKDTKNNGYLAAVSSSANNLKLQSSVTTNSSWKFTFTTTGVATATAQGTYTRKYMQYNKASSLFANYSGTTQSPLAIYVKASATTGTGSGSGSGSSSGSGSGSTTNEKTFNLVKSASDLTTGKYIMIVKAGGTKLSGYFAMKPQSESTSYVSSVAANQLTGTGTAPNTITTSDTNIIWTLTGKASAFTLTCGVNTLNANGNYLYYNTGAATTWAATYGDRTFTIKNGSKYLGLRDDLTLNTSGLAKFRCNSSCSSTSYQFYMYKMAG